jgi:hypothetical protein
MSPRDEKPLLATPAPHWTDRIPTWLFITAGVAAALGMLAIGWWG